MATDLTSMPLPSPDRQQALAVLLADLQTELDLLMASDPERRRALVEAQIEAIEAAIEAFARPSFWRWLRTILAFRA
jgi:DNA-binding transcriptional regulator YbjK